ncbi:hypothetical protein XHV734_3172 [Xanthomonas hortorum pv. vitians]|nr:hypothetical protein XHV734_3172 [Xanthomonas hortorum pv. vitians]
MVNTVFPNTDRLVEIDAKRVPTLHLV